MGKRYVKQMVIYSRKSKFTGKGESVENQIEMCRQYIALHYGAEEAACVRVYEDEGFSGGNLERPQFKKMMEDAKKLQFTAIVVYRLDRISRNIGDFAKLIEQLNSLKIDFISIKEQFDTCSPMGRAMMYISSVFSQLERETIAERIKDNMHELAKTGRWLGGTTPTGYESVSISAMTIDGKMKKACKLQILPEEIRLVELIFNKYLETGSFSQVEAFLLERRCLTKMGNRFTRFSIKNILLNPVYVIADEEAYAYFVKKQVDLCAEKRDFDGVRGIMAYNRTLQQTGKTQEIKPMNEWIVAVGQHEGVIAGKAWVEVQNRLEQNQSKTFRRTRCHEALLSGILRCGNCGDYLRPKLSNRKLPSGERVFSYLCSTKERSKKVCCQMVNLSGNLLDRMLLDEIKKIGSDPELLIHHLERSQNAFQGNPYQDETVLERLQTEQNENMKAIDNLVMKLSQASGTAAEGYMVQKIEELHGQNEQLARQITELKTAAKERALSGSECERLVQNLLCFGTCLEGLSIERKRTAVRSLVRRVVWDGKTAHIYLFGSDAEQDDQTGVSFHLQTLCEDSK